MNLPPPISSLIEESQTLERSGNIGAALQRAREALEGARASGEAQDIVAALICVAHVHFRLGHYNEARNLAEEALAHAAIESPAQADALRILGDYAHETGDLMAAERFYQRAIDLSRQLGYSYGLHRCLHSLSACVYIPRGQFELALAADEESLRLGRGLDMPEEIWLPLATMGWVYWVSGQRERAFAVAEEMYRVVQPGSLAAGYYFCLRADLAQEGESPDSALPLYARARSIAEAIGDPGLNAELRVGLSRYYRTAGNGSAAYDWADDALAIAASAGGCDLQGWALIERGRAAWEIGKLASAETDFLAVIEMLTPLQANFDLARVYFLLAALLHRRFDEACPERSRRTQRKQQRAAADAAWLEAVSRIISGGYAFLLEQERALAFPLIASYLNSADPQMASVSATLLSHLERVPPPPLHVLTLGRFEVQQGRRRIKARPWRSRRAGELFRLLLVSPGRSLFRDQVTEALWPDKSPASTRTPFHQATSALRHALEPDLPDKFPSRYLEVEGGRVTLRLPPGSWVDSETFEQHIQDEEWEAALALYRGELFPGDRYADWAAAQRERLMRCYVRALLALARERLEAERPQEALEACRRVLEIESWQENAVLIGMQACLTLNNRAGALRLYLALERTLREDLDIVPQESLQRLYQTLLQ
jgi:DNA-binding SARP family transcriptional activator